MSHLFCVSAGSTTHSSTSGSVDGGALFLFGVLGVCGGVVGSRRPVRELYTHPAPPTKPQRASSTQSQGQTSPSHWRAERPGRAKTKLEKVKRAMKRFSCNAFMIKRADQRKQLGFPCYPGALLHLSVYSRVSAVFLMKNLATLIA